MSGAVSSTKNFKAERVLRHPILQQKRNFQNSQVKQIVETRGVSPNESLEIKTSNQDLSGHPL